MAKNTVNLIMDLSVLILLAATTADARGVKKIVNINFVTNIQQKKKKWFSMMRKHNWNIYC